MHIIFYKELFLPNFFVGNNNIKAYVVMIAWQHR